MMNMSNETNTYGEDTVDLARKNTKQNVGVLRDNPTEVSIHLAKNDKAKTYRGGALLCILAHSIGVDDNVGTAKAFVTGKGKVPTGQQHKHHYALSRAIVAAAYDAVGEKDFPAMAAWIDAQVSALTPSDDTTDDTEDADDDAWLNADDDEAPAPSATADVTTPSDEVTVEALIGVVTGTPTVELLGNATAILQESGHRLVLSKGKVVDMTVAHPSWDTSWTVKDDAVKT